MIEELALADITLVTGFFAGLSLRQGRLSAILDAVFRKAGLGPQSESESEDDKN